MCEAFQSFAACPRYDHNTDPGRAYATLFLESVEVWWGWGCGGDGEGGSECGSVVGMEVGMHGREREWVGVRVYGSRSVEGMCGVSGEIVGVKAEGS